LVVEIEVHHVRTLWGNGGDGNGVAQVEVALEERKLAPVAHLGLLIEDRYAHEGDFDFGSARVHILVSELTTHVDLDAVSDPGGIIEDDVRWSELILLGLVALGPVRLVSLGGNDEGGEEGEENALSSATVNRRNRFS
jgi:hypothetical protein